jgi:hypothetical protein
MSFTDEILKSDIFRHFADKVDVDERDRLEESVREMLSSIDDIHSSLMSKLADQKGREEVADALEHLLTHEGQKKWLQDKN